MRAAGELLHDPLPLLGLHGKDHSARGMDVSPLVPYLVQQRSSFVEWYNCIVLIEFGAIYIYKSK